jgi:hypothetical protein
MKATDSTAGCPFDSPLGTLAVAGAPHPALRRSNRNCCKKSLVLLLIEYHSGCPLVSLRAGNPYRKHPYWRMTTTRFPPASGRGCAARPRRASGGAVRRSAHRRPYPTSGDTIRNQYCSEPTIARAHAAQESIAKQYRRGPANYRLHSIDLKQNELKARLRQTGRRAPVAHVAGAPVPETETETESQLQRPQRRP